jgi:hypothetical protein
VSTEAFREKSISTQAIEAWKTEVESNTARYLKFARPSELACQHVKRAYLSKQSFTDGIPK